MRALLNSLLLELTSDQARVRQGWRTVFDREIEAAAVLPENRKADIRLAAALVSQLPDPPTGSPTFTVQAPDKAQRTLQYYKTASGGFLNLARPAQIAYSYNDFLVQIALTQQVLDEGNLEDLSLIALAPFLRRRGCFMAHAFAASQETAVLLCGPPGSGKTTTGLALLQQGWRYLANDVTLMREDDESVRAYPSPGAINLHPHTLTLLPAYRDRGERPSGAPTAVKQTYARGALLKTGEHGEAAEVSHILFTHLTRQPCNSLHEASPAVGLARLIEENVDQWDRGTYEAHIDLLTRLSRQANFFDLHLTKNDFPTTGWLGNLLSAL